MANTNVTLPGGSGIAAINDVIYIASAGSPQVYNPIGNLGNWSWGIKAEVADTTNQGTDWRQRIATLSDGDKISVDIFFLADGGGGQADGAPFDGTTPYSPSFHNGLGAVLTKRQLRQYKVVFSDGTTWYMQAFVTSFPISSEIGKARTAKVEFQVTGEPIFA